MNGRLRFCVGNIAQLNVDAVVNAANAKLNPGTGIDGAIREGAGPAITVATQRFGHCPPGEVRTTAGYGLPAKFVIHAVAPDCREEDNAASVLREVYYAILREADSLGVRSVGIPAIGTGIFGFPQDEAASIAAEVSRAFFSSTQSNVPRVCPHFVRIQCNVNCSS
jgi:O-acetyl-ADP-ribose deacetylase (regulator of RNase III)